MATLQIFLIFSLVNSFGVFYCDSVPVGESCNVNEDCDGYPDSTLCEPLMGNICYCNNEHVPVGLNPTSCEKICDEIGESCKVSEQCTDGKPGDLSDCLPSTDDPNNLICNCTEDAINEPGEHVCHEIREFINDPCEVNAQCKFHLSEWGECSDEGKCSCRQGSVATNDLDKCLEIRNELELECQIPEQCTMGEPGQYSDCMESFEDDNEQPSGKICNCTEVAINEPGFHHCYLRRDELGQQCDVNAQCRVNMGDLSECEDGKKCTCTEDKGVPNLAEKFCLEIINVIGGDCTESQQCTKGDPGGLSECRASFEDDTKMICNCTDEAINQPGKEVCHMKAVEVGDACLEEAQCTANLGNLAECSNNRICECKAGTIPRENGTLCLAIRQQLGDTCEESRQCQSGVPGPHSICLEGKCECNSGAINEPGQHQCLERADLIGGICQSNMQCKANLGNLSECLGGHCVCTPEYAVGNENKDYCIPVINFIGGNCDEGVQCKTGVPGEHSDCLPSNLLPGSKVCNCTDEAVHQVGRHKCYKVADKIGESCDIIEQCWDKLGKLSECVGGDQGCQCVKDEAIGNEKGDKCLEIVDKIGKTCEENGQCVNGAPGHLSECGRNEEYPYDKICKCQGAAVKHPSTEECLIKAVNVGDRCVVSLQCTSNIGNLTECDNEGFCSCVKGAVGNAEGDKNTKCIPGGILIGNGCYDKAQCVGEMDVTSTCSLGICGCLARYTESVKLDNCLVVRDRLGDGCEEPQQCQQGTPGEWSECRENSFGSGKTCRCSEDATSEAGRHKCYKKATEVGGPCEVNVQCVANLEQSQCLNGRCVCMENSTVSENGDKCLSKMDLNQPCQDNNQCKHMDNVSCRKIDEEDAENMCRCNTGYVENSGKLNSCMKTASVIGDTCEDHPSQCDSLGGATCHMDLVPPVCQCKENEEVISKDGITCLKAIDNLHESCKEQVQCQPDNSVCDFDAVLNQTACICGNGFVETSDGKCLPVRNAIGQICEDTKQCAGIGANVECILNVCRCKAPFENYENRCYVPAKLGEDCNSSPQCFLGVNKLALCNPLSFTCTCWETAYQDGDICMAPKVVGDSCEMDRECTNTIVGPVYCSRLSNTCLCQEGYKADMDGLRCSSAYSLEITRTNFVAYLIVLIWSLSQYFY